MYRDPLIINCDGLCEPNPGGIATLGWIARQGDKEVHSHNSFVRSGPGATNNLAEYSAVISALEWLLGSKYAKSKVIVLTDSQLVERQLNGAYAVKASSILPLYKQAMSLVRSFKTLKVEWVPREKNEEADKLSRTAYKSALSSQGRTRYSKAREIAPRVLPLSDGTYRVPSQTYPGDFYRVDLGRNTCTCPDFYARGKKVGYCKHILAVRIATSKEVFTVAL